MFEQWRGRGELCVLVLTAAIALFLRAPALTAGLPYISYIDEGHVLHRVMHMLTEGTWEPGWYLYPSLLVNLIALAAVIADWLLPSSAAVAARIPVGYESFYDLIGPPGLILLGRLIVLVHSIGIVLLAYLLGRSISGRVAGLSAALLAAVLPALVSRSSIVIVDTVAACWVLAALVAAARYGKDGRGWLALLGGICSGLAFTAKYQMGAVFLAVIGAIWFRRPGCWRTRLRSSVLAGLGLLGASFAAMPALFLRLGEVHEDIRQQWGIYAAKAGGTGYLEGALDAQEAGVYFLAFAAIGFFLALLSKGPRFHVLTWIAFLVPAVILPLRFEFQPLRNMLSILALCTACVGCGVGVAWRWHRMLGGALLVGILVLSASLGMRSYAITSKLSNVRDSRDMALQWLLEHRQAGALVWVDSHLTLLPHELLRLGEGVRLVAPTEMPLAASSEEGWFLVGSSADALEGAEELASFGKKPIPPQPDFWRTNQLQVKVYRKHAEEHSAVPKQK